MGEVLERGVLRERVGKERSRGRKIVFTNGCFDILHRGHAECLKRAKSFGDVLVVGVNSDESVRRLKGPGRPFFSQSDRASLLAELSSVDYVCIFEEDTPLDLIVELEPDVLVKGADYALSQVVGAREVKSWGGEVRLVELVPGLSTSDLIRRIVGAPSDAGSGKA